MPRARCRDRGGLLVLDRRPLDVRPGWVGEVSDHQLKCCVFLEPLEEWPDDEFVFMIDDHLEDP